MSIEENVLPVPEDPFHSPVLVAGLTMGTGRPVDVTGHYNLCTTCAGLSCEPFKHWWLADDECQCIEREWISDPEVREKTLPCHLCQTCHLEVVRGHHRWRTVICSACQTRAREFNARVGRKVLLQGIHSMVNGGPVLQAPATATPKRLKDFAEGLNGMFSGIVWFGQTAKAQRIERLRQLGFESGLVVPLEQYLEACAAAGITKDTGWQYYEDLFFEAD